MTYGASPRRLPDWDPEWAEAQLAALERLVNPTMYDAGRAQLFALRGTPEQEARARRVIGRAGRR